MAGNDRGHLLKSSLGVAFATLASRLLGLVRVKLESLVLGGGEIASGWFLAFMIPNLVRRLLGEGALGTALIPLVAETEAQYGPDRVRRELAVIFSVLGAILALIVLFLGGGAWILGRLTAGASGFWGTERMRLCLSLLPLLMPYAFFICLVGAIGAVLNYSRVFVLPALGALLLNIFLICGLGAGWYFWQGDPALVRERLLPALSFLLLLSGAIQFALMLALLAFYGRFPKWNWNEFRRSDAASRLFKLALPGMLGGAALQVSFLVDRLLAAQLGGQAVPSLVYVDRIIDLPIGIFALSLGTVLMAAMARSAQHGREELSGDLAFGLRHVYFVCMPLAVLVILFHEPMLRLLCLGGNYTKLDLLAARYVAVFYGMGIPCFCSIKVILPAFYSRKIMDKPLYCSLAAISLNIVLDLVLMWPLKQGGIALATVISSLVNNTLLLYLLKREGLELPELSLIRSGARSLLLAALTGGGCFLLYRHWHGPDLRPWLVEFGMFSAASAAFALLYWCGTMLFRAPEPGEFLALLRRRKS